MQKVLFLYLLLFAFVMDAQENKDPLFPYLLKKEEDDGARIALPEGPRDRIYLQSEWKEGLLHPKMEGLAPVRLDQVRYRVIDGRMLVMEKGILYPLDPEKIKAVVIGLQRFEPLKYKEKGSIKTDYFEILHTGSNRLVHQYKMAVKKSDYDYRLNTGIKEDIVFFEPQPYIQRGSTPAMPLRKKAKAFFKILPLHKSKLLAFAKEKKLGFKQKEDLIQLIKRYNLWSK